MKAILAVTIVPIVAAYVAYYTGIGVPSGRVNEGILITGNASVPTLIQEADGSLPSYQGNHKWRLLIPITSPCDEACQELLYLTRQVHIRLGDKAERVERFAVNVAGQEGEDYLAQIAKEHPKLQHFTVSREHYDQWLANTNAPRNLEQQHYVMLIDQVGNAMMFYDSDNSGNQMLKDIKRVLRYSPE